MVPLPSFTFATIVRMSAVIAVTFASACAPLPLPP